MNARRHSSGFTPMSSGSYGPETEFTDLGENFARAATGAPVVPQDRELKQVLVFISLLVGTTTFILGWLNLMFRAPTLEIMLDVMMVMTSLCVYALAIRNRLQLASVLLIGELLVFATLAIYAQGTVRSSANMVFFGALVLTSILMPPRALVWMGAFNVLILGLLNWMELRGLHWRAPDFEVAPRFWLTQAATLVGLAACVYFAKRKKKEAIEMRLAAIKKRMVAEQERDRNFRRFERIFKLTPVPLMTLSLHSGAILDINPAFERIYGYNRDQVFGKTDHFLWVDPAEREALAKMMMATMQVENRSLKVQTASGRPLNVRVSAQLGEDTGQKMIICMLCPVFVE